MNSKPVNYKEAVEYIESIPKFTQKHTQEHTREFLERLGRPAFDRKVVHVAGTNGKGSVCAYIQAILEAEGKKTGFFTSPHLISINERIQIGREPIDNEKFYQVFEHVYDVVKKMEEEGIPHPSYFEFLFGMGLSAFEKSDVEYIVLETGLGGRLDATNAFPCPALTVITSISLDHTMILGNTIEQIAAEKAGIIKQNVPLVFDGSSPEASEVIRRQAETKGAECREITKHAFKIQEITDKRIAFSRVNAYDDNIVWRLSNSGIYQAMNASVAIAAMEGISREPVTKEKYGRWQRALAEVHWDGRMEEICPGIYLDGAHNPGAITAFCDSIQALGEETPSVILFSAVEDKEYESMIRELCERVPAETYVVTEIEDGRRVPAEVLKHIFEKYTDRPVLAKQQIADAWTRAVKSKTEQGKMYCLGSLYLAGMIKREILQPGS